MNGEMPAEELARVLSSGAAKNMTNPYPYAGVGGSIVGRGNAIEVDRSPGSIGSGFAQMSIIVDGIAGLITTLESRLDAVLLPNAPQGSERYPATPPPPPRSVVGSRSHELGDQLSMCLARLQSLIARVDL